MSNRPSSRQAQLTVLALLLVGVGAYSMVRDPGEGPASLVPCDPLDRVCERAEVLDFADERRATPLPADEFCVNVGYLCAALAEQESIRLHRWRNFEGTVVVHVPLPDFEDAARARELQRAAAQGVRAWNNQPFPILADLRGDRSPHFAVRWSPSLGGTQLGIARTQWSSSTGLSVLEIELASRAPPGTGAGGRQQIRLTAAHEMGHALGLGHSDSARDVMYPTNTATSMSAQDHRSMEVLYSTPDGTVIKR